jgi:hypothetical protein
MMGKFMIPPSKCGMKNGFQSAFGPAGAAFAPLRSSLAPAVPGFVFGFNQLNLFGNQFYLWTTRPESGKKCRIGLGDFDNSVEIGGCRRRNRQGLSMGGVAPISPLW